MKKLTIAFLALCFIPTISHAALIDIDTTYDLNSGLSSFTNLDNGPVSIADGDNVDLTVDFSNDLALTIEDGGEVLRGWLYAADNLSSFSLDNIVFELLGFSGTNGAQSVFNLGSQNGGAAHLGPNLDNFLSAGQSATFTGYRVTYDVLSIAQSPHDYGQLWFLASGNNLSVGPAPKVPEPSALALLGLGLLGFRLSRKK